MTRFNDKSQQRVYEAARASGAKLDSEMYLAGKPRRGSDVRNAYWNGRSGYKARHIRGSMLFAAWAAGRDDLRQFGRVEGSERVL